MIILGEGIIIPILQVRVLSDKTITLTGPGTQPVIGKARIQIPGNLAPDPCSSLLHYADSVKVKWSQSVDKNLTFYVKIFKGIITQSSSL